MLRPGLQGAKNREAHTYITRGSQIYYADYTDRHHG